MIFGFCVVLIAVAYFMEYQMGLEPCPMCIIQRIAIAWTGLAALIGYFHDRWFKFYFCEFCYLFNNFFIKIFF